MKRRLLSALAGAILMCASVVTPGESATLFSQPWVGPGGGGSVSDYGCCLLADDFTLTTDAWVADFHWWGGYTNTPTEEIAPADSYDLYIFSDLGTLLGLSAFAYSPLTNLVRTDTGDMTGAGNAILAYTSDLASPIQLMAGTYYALLVGRGDANSNQFAGWMFAGPTAGAGAWFYNGAWIQIDWDLAFEVTGSPIPEPATLLLLGTGLTAAGVRRRMKRRS
jgi:hypothetical protein